MNEYITDHIKTEDFTLVVLLIDFLENYYDTINYAIEKDFESEVPVWHIYTGEEIDISVFYEE